MFVIKCCKCGREQIIDKDNVQDFVNGYDWRYSDFKLGDMKIAAFVTNNTLNETVMCECGNKVRRQRRRIDQC